MEDIDRLKKLICETFPELKINKFSSLSEGKEGAICLANDEIVFKIPFLKNEGVNEAAVLRFLENKLDIEIPKVLYSAYSENGLYIIGETLLSGIAYSYELHDTFDFETKIDICRQLGKIVRSLHEAGGHDPSWLGCEETPEDCINEFNKRWTPETRNLFSGDEIGKIEKIAERYKKISAEYPVKPVLCHGDLHFYNLMFDEKNKRISGVLDFGCVNYGEPAGEWYYYFDPKYYLEGYGDNGDKYFSDRQIFHAMSCLLNNLPEQVANEDYKALGFIRKFILNE